MAPRAFLVRGLLVGLAAGVLAFVVAYLVGEPYVDRAVAIEEATAAHQLEGAHEHPEEAPVPRDDQRTWGLATGTLAIGLTYGGIAGLAAAGAVGRLGRLGARQTAGLVGLLGFVATVLLPFLKYPANPPSIGNPATIGERTGAFFAMQLVCVVGVVGAAWLAVRLDRRTGGFEATVAAAAAYLVLVVAVAQLLPAVDEVGDFPADLLWSFRVSSLITSATLWAVIGVGLVVLVGRLHDRVAAEARRRELAASL